MIGIVVATMMEAGPLIDRLRARKTADARFTIYSFKCDAYDGGAILVCGMGPEKARDATQYFVTEFGPSLVINIGICGSLSDEIGVGSIPTVGGVVDGVSAS